MPIREKCGYRKFGAIIMVYITTFILSGYRPYQTSYIYLFRCSFRTISNVIIHIRQDSACDARIVRDDPLPMQVIYRKGFSLA